jgi:NadR type nicotinamide-nucleotide adenylyltransferase
MATQLPARSSGSGLSSSARVIKVVLTGSESTGKTELARRLGEHFDAPVSVEYVRAYADEKDGKLEFADHGPIARGQIAAEDAAIALVQQGSAGAVVILDTDLVSTIVYCEHYFGRSPPWIEEQAKGRAGTLYLLMRPDVPWVADEVRDRGDRRIEMHELFRSKLGEFGLDYIEVGGDGEQRFRTAVEAIRDVVRRR